MDPTVVAVEEELRFSDGTQSGSYTTAPGPLAPLGASALTISASPFPIAVGGGGPGSTPCFAANRGAQGSTSSFQLFLLLEAEEVVLKIHLFNSVVQVVQVELVVSLILLILIIQVVVVKELATHLQ